MLCADVAERWDRGGDDDDDDDLTRCLQLQVRPRLLKMQLRHHVGLMSQNRRKYLTQLLLLLLLFFLLKSQSESE